ncbi:MAG: hypothetical protein LQ352_000452 [Teloschistes flavicans]|nr:MAG: hypothetical protein LQ352_000452 [Teloschistes flavicans]
MVLSRKDRRKASRELQRTSQGAADLSEFSQLSPAKTAVCKSRLNIDASSKDGAIQCSGPDVHLSEQRCCNAAIAKSGSKQSETSPKTYIYNPDNAGSAGQGGLLREDVNGQCSASSPDNLTEPAFDHGDVADNLDSTWDRPLSRISIILNTSGVATSPPSRAATGPGASNHKSPQAEARRTECTSNRGRPAPASDKSRPLYGKTLDTQRVEPRIPWNGKQMSQGLLPPWCNFATSSNSKTLHVDPNEFPKLPSTTIPDYGQPGTRPETIPDDASERRRQDQASNGFQLIGVAQTMHLPESVETRLHVHSPASQGDTSTSDIMTPASSSENLDSFPTEDDGRPLLDHNSTQYYPGGPAGSDRLATNSAADESITSM